MFRRPRSVPEAREDEKLAPSAESLLRMRLDNAWKRTVRFWQVFRGSGLGMAGLVILLIFSFMAVSAPILTGVGLLRNPAATLCGTDFHVCLLGSPDEMIFAPPNGIVWLGTDQLGRDVFSQLWWGSQVTILIGVLATVFSMGIGTAIGMISGYYGGWLDEILMRITDFFLVLPTLVFALILLAIIGPGFRNMVITNAVTFWASTARLVRSQVLSLKERQFVERARAAGTGKIRIVWIHIFPNAFSLVFAEAILTIAVAILTESFLSFLGFMSLDVITWGVIIEQAWNNFAIERNLIWWIVAPGMAIVAVVLGFTLLGYALDEIMNPRLRKR